MLGTWPLRHDRINVWKSSALKGKLKQFLLVDVKTGLEFLFLNMDETDRCIASFHVSDVARHKC